MGWPSILFNIRTCCHWLIDCLIDWLIGRLFDRSNSRFAELAQVYRDKGCKLLVYPGAFNMTTGKLFRAKNSFIEYPKIVLCFQLGRFLVVFWSFSGRFLVVFWSFSGRFLVVFSFKVKMWHNGREVKCLLIFLFLTFVFLHLCLILTLAWRFSFLKLHFSSSFYFLLTNFI